MTDVVERVYDATPEQAEPSHAEARRVLIILSIFMLVVLLANFWF